MAKTVGRGDMGMIHSNKDPQTATLTKIYEADGTAGLVLVRFRVRMPKEFLGI
jgi:hypothetical protein